LESEQTNPVALNALGMLALERAEYSDAADLFARAAAADPAAPPLWLNLAKAHRLLGNDEGERQSLLRVLGIDQRDLTALIRIAELHERRGEEALANQRWTSVVILAGQIEQPAPELAERLAHARAYVADKGKRFADEIDAALMSHRQPIDPADRRRFDACIDHLLGRRSIFLNQCEGIHYPFLPADEYFDLRHFPWLSEIEAKTAAIRAELEAFLRTGAPGFAPYVAFDSGTPENKWTKLDHSLDWSACHLWRFGVKDDAICAHFPETAKAMEALPLAQMPNRAPTVFFSILRPGAHIPPHTGVSNTRAIVHLPLIVPPGCAFRVGGETRQWVEGQAFVFDDTIEHEAWNNSDQLRAVLIFDTWNPHLTEVERALLQSYFTIADASGLNPRNDVAD
jgi:aspartyl/asparaginyl beta-hydroxylase (cupin superfamily)